MYSLVSALAKPLSGNGRWESVDIGSVPMKQLYSTYARVIATLSNPFLEEHVALELEDIRGAAGGLSATFNEYLTSNGNATLPTYSELPILSPKYAEYADAFHAGYTLTPIHPTFGDDTVVTREEQTALKLVHPTGLHALFAKHCLVNVNGFFHFSEAMSGGIRVHRGGQSPLLHAGSAMCGILSFRKLGEIQLIPITEQMIYKQDEDERLRDRVHLDMGIDPGNKTIMLVLGGYLHVLDRRTFRRIGDTLLTIDIGNLNLLDRYFESRPYIDYSGLQLQTTPNNPTQVGVDNFYSDAVLRRYLTLSQSFLVLLDNPDVFVEREYIGKTKTPNVFTGYTPPIFPLVVGHGKHSNYWYEKEVNQWSIHCHDSLRKNFVYNTGSPKTMQNVSDQRWGSQPEDHSRAFYLKIGTDF